MAPSSNVQIIPYYFADDVETGKRLWRAARAPNKETESSGKGKSKGKKNKKKAKKQGDLSKGHVGHVLTIAVSSDGRMLATGGLDRVIHMWDTRTRTQVDKFTGHRQAITVRPSPPIYVDFPCAIVDSILFYCIKYRDLPSDRAVRSCTVHRRTQR
jgi:WD40 repeat protein